MLYATADLLPTPDTALQIIRKLNDAFRQLCDPNTIQYSAQIEQLTDSDKEAIFKRVRFYNQFNYFHDPEHEHDFGFFSYDNKHYRWGIYYAAEKTLVDCKNVMSDAEERYEALKPHALEGKVVLCRVVLRDMLPKSFKYKTGERAGSTGTCLSSELASIGWVKVDGQEFTFPYQEQQVQATGTDG